MISGTIGSSKVLMVETYDTYTFRSECDQILEWRSPIESGSFIDNEYSFYELAKVLIRGEDLMAVFVKRNTTQ